MLCRNPLLMRSQALDFTGFTGQTHMDFEKPRLLRRRPEPQLHLLHDAEVERRQPDPAAEVQALGELAVVLGAVAFPAARPAARLADKVQRDLGRRKDAVGDILVARRSNRRDTPRRSRAPGRSSERGRPSRAGCRPARGRVQARFTSGMAISRGHLGRVDDRDQHHDDDEQHGRHAGERGVVDRDAGPEIGFGEELRRWSGPAGSR